MNAVEREALKNLAEALFPLSVWFPSDVTKRPYQPALPLAWRPTANQQNIAINDIKVIEFLEALLLDDDTDKKLAKRWRDIAKRPLAFHDTLPRREGWRKKRQRDDGTPALTADTASFGVAGSENFVLAEHHEPMTRGEFYQKCLGPFMAAVTKAGPKPVWIDLAKALLADKLSMPNPDPTWPDTVPKSSEFIRQFCKDIAFAALNFQSSATDLYPEAVAIELGEMRRPGNAYSVTDVQQAVAALAKKLASFP